MMKPLNVLTAGMSLFFACTPAGTDPGDAVRIVINEFMAGNGEGGPVDENGDTDDWIELYNAGDTPVDMNGLYLSDDSLQLHAYSLPDTVLAPGGFLLVWADDELLEGRWHAPFALSWQNGDEIILTRGRNRQIDRYQFFPENGNPLARVPGTSFGRFPDGDAQWGQQQTPSPGASNGGIR